MLSTHYILILESDVLLIMVSQSIAVYIKRSPTQITMSAQGLGELLIALPVRHPPPLPFPAAH